MPPLLPQLHRPNEHSSSVYEMLIGKPRNKGRWHQSMYLQPFGLLRRAQRFISRRIQLPPMPQILL